MKKTSTFYAGPVSNLTSLALLLALLGISSLWLANQAPVFADFIQHKLPSTDALLRWAAVC